MLDPKNAAPGYGRHEQCCLIPTLMKDHHKESAILCDDPSILLVLEIIKLDIDLDIGSARVVHDICDIETIKR